MNSAKIEYIVRLLRIKLKDCRIASCIRLYFVESSIYKFAFVVRSRILVCRIWKDVIGLVQLQHFSAYECYHFRRNVSVLCFFFSSLLFSFLLFSSLLFSSLLFSSLLLSSLLFSSLLFSSPLFSSPLFSSLPFSSLLFSSLLFSSLLFSSLLFSSLLFSSLFFSFLFIFYYFFWPGVRRVCSPLRPLP